MKRIVFFFKSIQLVWIFFHKEWNLKLRRFKISKTARVEPAVRLFFFKLLFFNVNLTTAMISTLKMTVKKLERDRRYKLIDSLFIEISFYTTIRKFWSNNSSSDFPSCSIFDTYLIKVSKLNFKSGRLVCRLVDLVGGSPVIGWSYKFYNLSDFWHIHTRAHAHTHIHTI